MLRRTWLLAAPLLVLADETQTITAWLGETVSRLSEDNAEEFLHAFRKDVRQKLATPIRGMLAVAEVSSSVEILTHDTATHTLTLDWYLDLRPKAGSRPNQQRRQTLTVQIEPNKKGWLIVSLTPLEFFAPPKFN